MLTLDAQVHAYERNHPGRPWLHFGLPGPAEVTGDEMVAAMDEVGVDGALLVSAALLYGYDPSYALSVCAAFPDRFKVVRPVDFTLPDVDEAIGEWAATQGAVGIRILLMGNTTHDPADPGLNRALAAAARRSLPVNIQCWDRLDQFSELASRNPDTQMLIDHLGMTQPIRPPAPAEPFVDLPKLCSLSAHDNVAVKITGACTMSHEPFPYNDLWDPLCRIFDAFGMDRCMWGTDWTRTAECLTYPQAVDSFRVTDRLSDNDRAALMGGTLQKIYSWPKS